MPILDDATTEALIAQHGPNLETIELEYFDGPIVVRPPTSQEWRLFRDDAGGVNVEDRLAFLGVSCVVFPDRALVNEAIKDRPALANVLGNEAARAAGAVVDVKRKKLARPSAIRK